MKFLTLDLLLPRIVGFLVWSCCLVIFPTFWAAITLGIGAFQVLKCEKINSTVNKLFHQRTTTNSSLGYIEGDEQ